MNDIKIRRGHPKVYTVLDFTTYLGKEVEVSTTYGKVYRGVLKEVKDGRVVVVDEGVRLWSIDERCVKGVEG